MIDQDAIDEDDSHAALYADELIAAQRAAAAPVGSWTCRVPACRAPVAVTSATVEALRAFNAIISRQNEAIEVRNRAALDRGVRPEQCERTDALIREDECVFCERCELLFREKRAQASQDTFEKIQKCVNVLRDADAPKHEINAAEDWLERRANEGRAIVLAYRAKRNGGGNSNRPRGGL